MWRFDLLDEFTTIYVPFRPNDASHERDHQRRIDTRVDRHWLLLLALLVAGKRPG